jgi:hypothetical protein
LNSAALHPRLLIAGLAKRIHDVGWRLEPPAVATKVATPQKDALNQSSPQ